MFKKKRGNSNPVGRQVDTRCETNLERLGRLFPNADQYNSEVGKAFQKQGTNFNSWAQSKAEPCFVVGADQGGLQSGGISFDGSLQEIINEGKKRKIFGRKQKGLRLEGLNFTGSRYFN